MPLKGRKAHRTPKEVTVLILTRKLGEAITIGDNIRVSVLGVRGRQVRLGIEAPQAIVVHREEIAQKIAQSKTLSTASPPTKKRWLWPPR